MMNCSICFHDIHEQDICTLNCNHQFCKNCIDKILKTNNKKCPNCRADITSYNYHNENNIIIIIQPDNNNTELRLYQTRAEVLYHANNKLLKYSYCTTFALLYFIYAFMNKTIECYSQYKSMENEIDQCNHNYTELINDINDESRSVILYNYIHNAKCNIPDLVYNKCFLNI